VVKNRKRQIQFVSIETGERTKNVYAGIQIISLDKER
jgi:hypothetical protein